MEMQKLAILLANADIPFDYVAHSLNGSLQICYPVGPAGNPNCVCDVVCFPGTYGYEAGLLEIMGLNEDPCDDVEGYLDADEVFNRIWKHYHAGD